jgi:S1-C subfamily serine protease
MNKPLFVEINGTRIGQLSAAALNNYQDTALVKVLDTYNDPVNEITGLGTITGIHALQDIKNNLQKGIHDRVVMHGAATGSVTSGTIVSFSSSQPIPYLNGQHPISMYDLIQTTRISNKGDSGSAVLDDSNRLIGLLIADDSLYSYIIPVTRILNEFNLQFL